MKLIKNLSCGIFILLLFILLIGGYFIFDYFKNSSQENQIAIDYHKNQKEIVIRVLKGEILDNVITQLYEKKLISNQLYFRIFTKINQFTEIQAGLYKIKPGADYEELMYSLRAPFELELEIFFPEGLRMDEVAERITEQFNKQSLNELEINFDKAEFLTISENPHGQISHPVLNFIPVGKSLEGFLFPDTYFFPEDASTKDVIFKLLDNFEIKLQSAKKDFKGIPDLTLTDYEIITLSSIVEKEGTGENEDNAKIADVFYKRLKGLNGPPKLESDVVILYQLKDWKATIYQTDLDNTEYKFNSHVNEGLPPTPICNMGLISLTSAFHPTPNDYLFFLADENGKVYYGRDYNEHLINISKYLKN